jgi:hypothetical protein
VVEASGGGLWIETTVPLVRTGNDSVVVALSYHAAGVGVAQAGAAHLDQMASADLFANRDALLVCAPAQLASVSSRRLAVSVAPIASTTSTTSPSWRAPSSSAV